MSDDDPAPSGELAEQRTDLAEDRTILANERTFAGWYRTGMAAVGIAVGFGALYRDLEPVWVPKAIGTAFLLAAAHIFIAADRRACRVLHRLEPHEVKAFSPMNLRLLTVISLLGTAMLVVAIWLLRF